MKYLLLSILSVLLTIRVNALVYMNGPANRNTNAPTNNLVRQAWDLQGEFGFFLGTPIAKKWFVTVKHIGGNVGDTFTINNKKYKTTYKTNHPSADLTLWKVDSDFSSVATIGDFGFGPSYVFGRGMIRGPEIFINTNQLRGWYWANGSSVKRWGTTSASFSVSDPKSSTVIGYVSRKDPLYYDVAKDIAQDFCSVASGDSSGGVFKINNNQIELTGLIYAVSDRWSFTNSGPTYLSTLVDSGGLWLGVNPRNYVTDTKEYDFPSTWQAIDLSFYKKWILNTTK